jgi:hypothetical protein
MVFFMWEGEQLNGHVTGGGLIGLVALFGCEQPLQLLDILL